MRYFIQLAEYKTYARAARESYISPQGLWRSVHALEKELDAPLVLKTDRGLVFTEAGKRFLAFAENVLREYDAFNRDLDVLTEAGKNQIQAAFVIGSFGALDAGLIERFQKEYPQIRLDYRQFPDYQVDEKLIQKEYRLGLTRYPFREEELTTTLLLEVPLYIWVSRENPLSRKPSLTILDLKDQPLISVGPEYKTPHRMDEECRNAGFEPLYLITTEERPASFPYVYKNQGLLPALEYENISLRSDLAKAVPLAGFFDYFGISHRKDCILTEAEKLFLRHLKSSSRFRPR
ncbi:MAG: LysR family transcriptional regulator [Lachnospiraceae bacterium]|nr:LysR family transcriptional regulator [Lachnospiraceae bacterium]